MADLSATRNTQELVLQEQQLGVGPWTPSPPALNSPSLSPDSTMGLGHRCSCSHPQLSKDVLRLQEQ